MTGPGAGNNGWRMAMGVLAVLSILGGCQGAGTDGLDAAEVLTPSQQGIEARGAPVQLSGGLDHSLAVRQDGTVWAWGSTCACTPGTKSETTQASPVPVPELTNAISVAAGKRFSLALKSDGTVWSWGYNPHGNLGDNTGVSRKAPVRSLMTNAIAITASANGYQAFALKSDGTVWAWGYNGNGELGDGSKTSRSAPIQVKQSVGGVPSPLTEVIAISAGTNHTLALKSNGTVWAWGLNTSGQLGNRTLASQPTAVQVVDLMDAVAVSAGQAHSLALRADGSVVSWGDNTYGQLGNGTTTRSLGPVNVPGLSNVKSLDAGGSHSLALKSDGTVSGWGSNPHGELGNDSTATSYVPVSIPTLSNVTALSAGVYHSHALSRVGGTLFGWGYSNSGQVGDTSKTTRIKPVIIPLTAGTQGVASGDQHTVHVKWDGTVWAWGSNVFGNVGDGTPLKRPTPVQVIDFSGMSLTNVVMVAAGTNYSLALKSNGTVFAWGQNDIGQLGDSTTTSRGFAAPIPELNGIVAIAAGTSHGLALRFDGKVYAWGRNHLGQLGDQSQIDRRTPVPVHYLGGVVSIAAGGAHSLAVQQNGSVYAWGNGEDGQLCDSIKRVGWFRDTINQVLNVPGVISVAAGTSHSLFLDAAGKAWACGDNLYGQLGDGTIADKAEPVAVTVQDGSTTGRLAAGGFTSALSSNTGFVYTWGRNDFGQLGDGNTANRTLPTQVASSPNVMGISIGTSHISTMRTNGTVYTWGRNNHGQLGDGSQTNRPSPTQALLP